jgi:uncharacterized repeat protein (TIGR01451 family)
MYKLKNLAIGLVTATVAAMPFVAMAAETVRIESQLSVANVTAGDTQYKDSVGAKVDEVVKVQVYYHNKEADNSGKVANNLRAKINIPNAPGKVQTLSSTVSADNSNTVNDTATINLSSDKAYLEYIPGSAEWRHNAGTNDNVNYVTEKISDAVVTSGTGLVLENAKPCFNFEAYVTILVRVKASGVSIVKQVRKAGETSWSTANTAKPGDTLEYMITFENKGNTTLKNVIVGDNMPAFVTYVPGSTKLKNSANPNGVNITNDNITKGGIDVGNYTPGANGHVLFQAKIDSNLKCGKYVLKNVGVVRPEGMNEFENYANTTVDIVCAQTPPPVTPPVTPPAPQPELPQTGMEGAALAATGTGAIGYAVRRYRLSKRSLIEALKR